MLDVAKLLVHPVGILFVYAKFYAIFISKFIVLCNPFIIIILYFIILFAYKNLYCQIFLLDNTKIAAIGMI
jgi:hypothetical protein